MRTVNQFDPLLRTHFVKPYQPTGIAVSAHLHLSLRGAPAHPELVEVRGSLVEVEYPSVHHHCYGDHCYANEIATLRSQ